MKNLDLKSYLRLCVRLLRGHQPHNENPFEAQKMALTKAVSMVHYFYSFLFLLTLYLVFFTWEDWILLSSLPQPLWPVMWMNKVPFASGLNSLCVAALISTLLAATNPKRRIFRILSFVTVFQVVAMQNSFGKINHDMYIWVTAGFFFIFLPSEPDRSITKRHQYLTAFFGTQLLTLSFYTSSGVWKIAGVAIQFVKGEMHALHPFALSQHIANRLLQTNYESILGEYMIENPILGWPLFAGAIFLELFSIFVAFRPSLHRFWGMSLVMLHLGIWLTLFVPFATNIVFAMIFFVHSPFLPEKFVLKDFVYSLPILGDALAYLEYLWSKYSHPYPLNQPHTRPAGEMAAD